MTISKAEFIKYLQELPEEITTIEVVCGKRGHYENYTTVEDLTHEHLDTYGDTLRIGTEY